MGVNVKGDSVLFDFGLAKELKERDLVKHPDGYNATGVTGSRRYMAPEVVKSTPYGFKADVFSFGILLWEIIALKKSFAHFDAQKHYDFVVTRGKRPAVDRAWPVELRVLLSQCWANDPADRVDITQVCVALKRQIVKQSRSSNLDEEGNELHASDHSVHAASRQVSIEVE